MSPATAISDIVNYENEKNEQKQNFDIHVKDERSREACSIRASRVEVIFSRRAQKNQKVTSEENEMCYGWLR